MPALRVIETTAQQWGVGGGGGHAMHWMLRQASGHHHAAQSASNGHAGCDTAQHHASHHVIHDGRRSPARQPEPGETPLSWAEVRFGIARGLI